MTNKHARLSPSSAHRWLVCPGSVLASQGLPDETSRAAEEGTLLHEEAADYIRLLTSGKDSTPTRKTRAILDDLYGCYTDQRLLGYIDFVESILRDYNVYAVAVEKKVTPLGLPDSYGSADLLMLTQDPENETEATLRVIDFKTGYKSVKAQDNPQLILYALGGLEWARKRIEATPHERWTYGQEPKVTKVLAHIVQPSLHYIGTATYDLGALERWRGRLMLAAEQTKHATWTHAGEHCTYCRAKTTCPRRLATFNETAGALIRHVETLQGKQPTPATMAKFIQKAKQIKEIQDVYQGKLTNLLLSGQAPKKLNLKLVSVSGRRQISNEDELAQRLADHGYNMSQTHRQTLKPLTQLEKAIGKNALYELAGDLIEKPPPRPALADLDDVRPDYKPEDVNTIFKD